MVSLKQMSCFLETKMLSYRTSERNTPIWVWLLVMVYENWVFSRNSGRDWSMTYKLQYQCMTYKLQYQCRTLVKLIYTRLAIQDIVHCTIVNKCSICPRWKFNLIVSVNWYINEGMRAFLVWLEILGGGCWNYGFGPFIFINAIKRIQSSLLNASESIA